MHIPLLPRSRSGRLFGFLFGILGIYPATGCTQDASLPTIADLKKNEMHVGNDVYSIVRGDAYKYNSISGTWAPIDHLYDPDYFDKNYVANNGIVYRKDDSTGMLYAVSKHFASGFEHATNVRDLIGEQPGWTSFILQSPQAPTVEEYVRLRTGILGGLIDFKDNRVEPSRAQFHSGSSSLRATSVAKSPGMQCAKACIETELIHFVQGDDYWFSGWYFLDSGMPYTIADIKSSWITNYPGMRLVLENGEPQFEFKWMERPRYLQAGSHIKFPSRSWTHVVIHLRLSAKDDGLNELWLDDKQVIHAAGRNLPFADAIYNHAEVGISATLDAAVVFVDDIIISDHRP